MKKYFFLALIVLLGCTSSPTGRSQFIVVSDNEMSSLGYQAFDEMKKKTPIETNPRIVSYAKCIANAIAQEAKDPTGVKNWEVVVFQDKTANAFALPGGKIGVHTGILPYAKSQNQLAAVLGHEVGHVIARHGAERVSNSIAVQSGLMLTSILVGEDEGDSRNKGMLMAALGVGAQFGVLMPHGRKQESEADEIGLYLMAEAGFNPEESILLWRNMAQAGGGSTPEFLSTHPSNETRIDGLREHMVKANQIYRQAQAKGKNPVCGSPY